MLKDCTTCKHRETPSNIKPCKNCLFENWQSDEGFDYSKAQTYLQLAQNASGTDEQLEANILVRLSKMIMEFNTGK